MLNHRTYSRGILINLSWSSLQAFFEASRVARILKINYLRSQKIAKPPVPTTNPRSRASLFHIARFDPPGERKQFLPLTLWRAPSGLRWRWKGVPSPRPLYGLDVLAGRPDVAVVVCEGEKAADAAARVFVKSVAITSSGGSQAAAKTDWTPLAGRRILIWPDADAAGAKYAGEVAAILVGIGCEVTIIDAVALASIDPFGGQREPENGWDAADAVGEWKDAGALRKATAGLARSFDAGPTFVCHGQFEMRADGLWCRIPGKSKKDGDEADEIIWLSGPFEIPGRARRPR